MLRFEGVSRCPTALLALCYSGKSVASVVHFTVSIGDAIDQLREGCFLGALRTLMDDRNASSLGAVFANVRVLSKLAKLG
jgi:hypothetical protein